MSSIATKPAPIATARQQTLARECVIRGKGLLLGHDAELVICPGEPDSGIVFERVDIDPPVAIPALAENVVRRPRRTTLRSGEVSIETIEHCMSALAGLRIDNAVLRLRGPELPIGDGSALPFVEPMLEAGVEAQEAARRVYKLTEAVSIDEPGATVAALPHDEPGMRVVFDLDYRENAHRIGKQAWSYDTNSGDYLKEVAPARTFSLREEAEALWAAGMCRHLTPRDVLVIGEDGPIDNAFRFENEPVRHKVLDLIGDLYLTGCSVACRVLAHRSGHHMNRRLAQAIRQRMRLDARAVALSESKALDARAIARLMPHRYPMLLVDRVLEIDQGKRAVGVKNVTINEPCFPGHYPGTPIMPGVLIVEAMAQLAGLMLSQQLEHSGKVAILLSMDGVKLRKAVTPGDQLILEAETIRATSRNATVQCRASVGNKTSAEALIRFMMVDPDFA